MFTRRSRFSTRLKLDLFRRKRQESRVREPIALKSHTHNFIPMRLLPLVILSVCLTPLVADEALPSYLVVAPEGMEDRLVERVQEWMSTNLHYETRVERLPDWEVAPGVDQITEVLKKIESPGMVTVILSNHLGDGQHALVDPERRAGVVNVPLLVPEVEEKTLRRLDRQAMRIVGFSLGIPPQPIPFCSLYPYKTLDQLDQIGRGFSPPAMALYRRQLQKKGFPLSPEADKRLPKVKGPAMKSPAPKE